MSDPDPYASPPREAEGREPVRAPAWPAPGQGQPPAAGHGQQDGPQDGSQDRSQDRQHRPQGAWQPPTGAPLAGPTPPADAADAAVLGALGLLASATGLALISRNAGSTALLGLVGLLLGLAGMVGGRRRGWGTALAALVAGALVVVVGGVGWSVREPLEDYRGCRKASVSPEQDRACRQQLEDRISAG